jgi:hypothetical protein
MPPRYARRQSKFIASYNAKELVLDQGQENVHR